MEERRKYIECGNVYNNPEYLNNVEKAVQDAGLDISKMIK